MLERNIQLIAELNRNYNRIKDLYDWKIINGKYEDSFHSPKEILLTFFRVWYELKENLKLEPWLSWYNWVVEKFCKNNDEILLSIDIANYFKHWKLDRPKTNKIIWNINTQLIIFDKYWKDRTNITIEIDWIKIDSIILTTNIIEKWNILINNIKKDTQ